MNIQAFKRASSPDIPFLKSERLAAQVLLYCKLSARLSCSLPSKMPEARSRANQWTAIARIESAVAPEKPYVYPSSPTLRSPVCYLCESSDHLLVSVAGGLGRRSWWMVIL